VTITSSEREAINRMMDYINEERARLLDQYTNLLDRLRELDNIDTEYQKIQPTTAPVPTVQGVTITNSSGGIDLSSLSLDGLTEKFEADFPVSEEDVIFDEFNEPLDLEQTSMNLAELIEEHKKQFHQNDENKDSWAYDSEKELLREKSTKTPRKKRAKRTSGSFRDNKAVDILKEIGKPIKTADLIKRLREEDIEMSSPYALLNNVRKYEPGIEKVGFGFYQFNASTTK